MRQLMLNSRQVGGPVLATGPTVSSEYLRLVAHATDAWGLETSRLLANAGIDPGMLKRTGARVGVAAVERTWEGIVARVGDPQFGLHVAEANSGTPPNLLTYIVRSSATAGAALGNVARYGLLMSNAELTTMVVSGNEAAIRFQTDRAHPYAVEMIVGLCATKAREQFGPDWRIKHVSFAHPAHGCPSVYEKRCGAPVYFEMPFTEIVFSRELLDLPMPSADPHLNAVLTGHADALLATVVPLTPQRPFVAQLEHLIRTGLDAGDFTLVRLADQVGMSARSVQRKLRDAGLTHRGLVRKVRQEVAARSLQAPVTQGRIARALGYSSPGAFQRAFKSWSGVTPAQVRKRGAPRRRALRN